MGHREGPLAVGRGLEPPADVVEAAALIHTDLAAKFNRARVVGSEDFRRIGSIKDVKEQGLLRLEGKTYVLQDGDVIEILKVVGFIVTLLSPLVLVL